MRDDFYNKCETVLGAAYIDRSVDPPVLKPPSPQLLRELVKCSAGAKQGLRIVGGGTMPSRDVGQQAPTVSLADFDAIPEVNIDDRLVVAQAGAPADKVAVLAQEYGLSLPFGLTSGDRATVGGMYMTDAYVGTPIGNGTMQSWVIGVNAIAASGDMVTFGGRTVKNVTGFDVTRMLAGTMGLYAIATQLILRALPAPEYRRTVLITVPGEKLGAVLIRLDDESGSRMERVEILAPEGLGGTVIIGITIEGFNPLVKACASARTNAIAKIHGVDSRTKSPDVFVKKHRGLSQDMTGHNMFTLTVPRAALPVMLDWMRRHTPESPVIAHVAHGRIHVSQIGDDMPAQLRERSCSIGGTMPAAWGQGMTRSAASLFTEAEITLARALKCQLDPDGIFNPHLWI